MSQLASASKLRTTRVPSLSLLSSPRAPILSQIITPPRKFSQIPAPNKPKAPQTLIPKFPRRQFHSTPPTMASKQAILTETLTPELLAQLRTFWFDHICTDHGHILPSMDDQMRWFKKDEQFDHDCATQFKPALETILASGATAPDILAAVDTSIALNWVSLILLLDQIPRNCYRGPASKTVFTRFDPLALGVALEADARGITALSPDVRWRIAYRTWFHLPLMHSEELGVHERAVRVHGETMEDFRGFLAKSPAEVSEGERGCWEVLKQREGEVMERLEMMLSFEVRHKVIIERFGRYPHRNGSMGRETTAEETDYLENGGDTFG